ncbi:MAG TPA: hypothetical protein VFK89_10965 [Actinomycetota bacterium]|nr:hypothetical protein [Actinomycetota bacterium]
MTKSLRFALGLVAGLVLAACAGAAATMTQPAGTDVEDLLYLQSGRGDLAVITPDGASPRFHSDSAVPAPTWGTVVRAQPSGKHTIVTATDPATGATRWFQKLSGMLRVKVVSSDGSTVALARNTERYNRDGRKRTSFVIAGANVDPRVITVDGNYEPDAFSTDDRALFVIRYLPATAPEKYQVRRLDLDTEKIGGVVTPDKDLQKAMGGSAQVQASSPEGDRLYTLYTVGGHHGTRRYAFVHTLDLHEQWAHCIDLPEAFASHADWATALTVSADGSRLFVANTFIGRVAVVDTATLKVLRTGLLGFTSRAQSYAAHDSGSTLYVGSGNRVVAIDDDTLSRTQAWDLEDPISGIQVSSDGHKVYVGLIHTVIVFDVDSGDRLETFDPPGVRQIYRLGLRLQRVDEVRTTFTCAC